MPSASSSAGDNEAMTVTSMGVAAIAGNNTAAARRAAIDDALRKAVEQTVGTMISSDTMVGNYRLLKDTVYTKSEGYIKNYSILNESQGQGIYQVSIRATVSARNLKNDLDAAGLISGRPRVLFMIAEANMGQKYYKFWWGAGETGGETFNIPISEVALKEIFLKKGFSVVDVSGATGKIDIESAYKIAEPANEAAASIGKKLNAEIVIKGKALASQGPGTPGGSVGLYLADMAAQAIRADTGEVLASASSHATARSISDIEGGSEAIKKASMELADKMIAQILEKWSQGNNIIIKMIGVTDYKDVADLKDVLKTQINGIKAVDQRKFEGGEVVLEAESRVPAHDIADEISGLPGAPYKVVYTSANIIEIVVNAAADRR